VPPLIRHARCGILDPVKVALSRIAAALVVATSFACSSGPSAPSDEDYIRSVEAYWADRNQFMLHDPDSPVPADKKSVLLPLKVYPPNPALTAPASLRLVNQRPVFEMPTSTGTIRRMQRVGVLEFTLMGQPMTLGAFVEEGTQQIVELFVPFADETTGKETYEAGRYLTLAPKSTNLYEVDFNKAYNPFCAYNKTYECPFPPPSNRLKMAIRAGEKLPGA
jgi:uncharacterized protein